MISVKNVSKKFGEKFAVNNISFSAPSGMITGLIGSNGAGKSTAMRLMCTLLKPTSGSIMMNNIDVVKSPQKAREKIGILLGGDVTLYDRLTAKENILYFADLQGMKRTVSEKRLLELSALLGMNEYLDRQVSGFSRGMRQKVAFGRSIIHSPDVLLLDEPSTGLDINSIRDVQNFILHCKKQGKTIVLSTHNPTEMALCDHVVFIENGVVIGQGSKTELFEKTGCKSVSSLFFYFRERTKAK